MSNTKRILITGANKGIGLATVSSVLSHAPTTHVFLGSRSAERGQAARESLVAENPEWASRIEVVEIDVSDDDSVASAADHVRGVLAGNELYGVVNNAGIGFGEDDMAKTLNVNTRGPKRVFEAFRPLLAKDGRVVNVSSAAGPNFVNACSSDQQALLTNPAVTWEEIQGVMERCLSIHAEGGDFDSAGFGGGDAYGLSKACLNAYTLLLAREYPELTINACTPGFIETDLTRHFAATRGVSAESMGMKPPEQGTRATMHLLFGDVTGRGWFFGSDAERSPLDRYRSPGDPPYTGE